MKITAFSLLICLAGLCSCTPQNSNAPRSEEVLISKDKKVVVKIKYNESGDLDEVFVTDPDTAQSVWIGYERNGPIMSTGLHKQGKGTHGVEYYPNGKPKGLLNIDSTFTGDAYYYYENGNKRSEGRWENGEKVGEWKEYNESGELIKTDTLD